MKMASLIYLYIVLAAFITTSYCRSTQNAVLNTCLLPDLSSDDVDLFVTQSLCVTNYIQCAMVEKQDEKSCFDVHSSIQFQNSNARKVILSKSVSNLTREMEIRGNTLLNLNGLIQVCSIAQDVSESFACLSESSEAICDSYLEEVGLFVSLLNSWEFETELNDCSAKVLKRSLSYFRCVAIENVQCLKKQSKEQDVPRRRVKRADDTSSGGDKSDTDNTFNIVFGAVGIIVGIALVIAIGYGVYTLFFNSPPNSNLSRRSSGMELSERPMERQVSLRRPGPSRLTSLDDEVFADERMDERAERRKENAKKAGKFMGEKAFKSGVNRLSQPGGPLDNVDQEQMEQMANAAKFGANVARTGIAIANSEKGSEERRELVEGAARNLMKVGARQAMNQHGGFVDNMDDDQRERMVEAAKFGARAAAEGVRRGNSRAEADYDDRRQRAPPPPVRSNSRPESYGPGADYEFERNNQRSQIYPKPVNKFSYIEGPRNYY